MNVPRAFLVCATLRTAAEWDGAMDGYRRRDQWRHQGITITVLARAEQAAHPAPFAIARLTSIHKSLHALTKSDDRETIHASAKVSGSHIATQAMAQTIV